MAERGTYAKGRAKRDEIVDVAVDVFAEVGYDRTSLRDIARRANLSQAGLLHHFKNKEELFLEVLRRRDVRNEHFYEETGNPAVSLPGLVEIVRHNAQEPGLVRLYVTMSAESTAADSTARDFFHDRFAKLLDDVAADIRHRKESGDFPAHLDEHAVASLLVAAADGLQLQWLLDPSGFDMGDRLELLVELLKSPKAADATT